MAIDTETKRRSVAMYNRPGIGPLPTVDGTIAAADRAHVKGLYSGLTYSTPAAQVIFERRRGLLRFIGRVFRRI